MICSRLDFRSNFCQNYLKLKIARLITRRDCLIKRFPEGLRGKELIIQLGLHSGCSMKTNSLNESSCRWTSYINKSFKISQHEIYAKE